MNASSEPRAAAPAPAPPGIDSVLEFWFGDCGSDGSIDTQRNRMWFQHGPRHDAEIRARFAGLHALASRGELDAEWPATPRGRLALVLVLDQFSRHIHRDTPTAFAQDAAAQRLVTEGLDRRLDHGLIPAARAFFYMPLQHAEDMELQHLSVRCFEGLARTVAEPCRGEYERFLDYARRHMDIIRRFGRFPHRNAILSRPSTAEEAQFLTQPGSSF